MRRFRGHGRFRLGGWFGRRFCHSGFRFLFRGRWFSGGRFRCRLGCGRFFGGGFGLCRRGLCLGRGRFGLGCRGFRFGGHRLGGGLRLGGDGRRRCFGGDRFGNRRFRRICRLLGAVGSLGACTFVGRRLAAAAATRTTAARLGRVLGVGLGVGTLGLGPLDGARPRCPRPVARGRPALAAGRQTWSRTEPRLGRRWPVSSADAGGGASWAAETLRSCPAPRVLRFPGSRPRLRSRPRRGLRPASARR